MSPNGRNQRGSPSAVYDPWHYLGALERKLGARRDGAPFRDWDPPVNLRRVRAAPAPRPGGDREFVELLAAQRFGLPWQVLARKFRP